LFGSARSRSWKGSVFENLEEKKLSIFLAGKILFTRITFGAKFENENFFGVQGKHQFPFVVIFKENKTVSFIIKVRACTPYAYFDALYQNLANTL
jgi:hypothetical protein